jgi:hypothetical protein
MPTGFPDYYGGLTLPVTVLEGGTGLTSITANAVLLGNGTGTVALTNVGTANQVLQIPSGGGPPTFQSLVLNIGAVTGILPIANGGTGTATPALVAGANIVITGSWPGQTIALSATPSLTTLVITPTVTLNGLEIVAHSAGAITAWIEFVDATGPAYRGALGLSEGASSIITGDAAGDISLVAATGKLILGTSATDALHIDQSQIVTLAHPLPIASGGTGAATLEAANLPVIEAKLDLTAQTASIATATLYAVPAARQGLYEIAVYLETTTAGTAGNVTATVASVDESGTSESKTTAAVGLNGLGANLGTAAGSSPWIFYSQASQNITYSTTVTGALNNPQYSVRFRVKYLG